MHNIADRPPPPGTTLLDLAKVLGYVSIVIALVTAFVIVLPIPAAVVGMKLSRTLSPEAAGWLTLAGGFVAGYLSSRILSRRCRWA